MEKLVINGPTRLKGDVNISGAKNAAVAIIPATLLIDGECTLENVPNISDVKLSCTILEKLGAKITWLTENSLKVDTRKITSTRAPLDITSKFRASYYLIGSLLSRCGKAEVGLPGGCKLGARPIDQHIKGFEALGANTTVAQGKIIAEADRLVGTSIYMDTVSVGATINVMLAAVLAEGITTIDNAAKEPHVVDVANFLNTMGADIHGAGTDVIKVTGVKKLHGNATYSIVPDQIEAGTFMLAAIASKGDVVIHNCIPKHLECLTAKILEIGGNVEEGDDSIHVWCDTRPSKATIKTLPYPGFPTDLQAIAMTLLTTANGVGIITESLYENRFMQVPDLRRMGADIHQDRNHAIVKGVKNLTGATIAASDLRAGAALVIAGLMANGQTIVEKLHHIDRGYEEFEHKLTKLGAKICRYDDSTEAKIIQEIRGSI